jgi:hypothetical protein
MSDIRIYTEAQASSLVPLTGDVILCTESFNSAPANSVHLCTNATGPVWKSFANDSAAVPSFSSSALVFDGVDDLATVSGSSTHIGAMSLWFKPSTEITTSSTQTVFMHTANAGSYSMRMSFSGNLLTFYPALSSQAIHFNPTTYNSNIPSGQVAVPTSFAADTWQHFVLNYDSSNGYQIYLNGQNVTTTSQSAVSKTSSSYFGISRPPGYAYYNHFGGLVDDFAVWSNGLTSSDIESIFNGTPGSVESGKPNDIRNLSISSQPGYYYLMGDATGDTTSSCVNVKTTSADLNFNNTQSFSG